MGESRWQARTGVLNSLSLRLLREGLTLTLRRATGLTPMFVESFGFDRVGRRA